MEKHAVLGAGNLGIDLVKAMHADGMEAKLFSRSRGFKYPCSLHPVVDYVPTHIWCCIGAGSVDQAKRNYLPFLDLHVRLASDLVQNVNERVRLHFFSTDHAVDEEGPKSLYALSKIHMEETLRAFNRPNTFAYRVGSLYGEWKSCFPSKIRKALGKEASLTLPLNKVTPTPTKWLARFLVNAHPAKSEDTMFFNVAPQGNVSVLEWGRMIASKTDSRCSLVAGGVDPDRPEASGIGCTLFNTSDTWSSLWSEYGLDAKEKK